MSQLKGKALAEFTYHQTEKVLELQEEIIRLKEQNARFEEAYKRLLVQVHYMKTLDYSLGLILD